MSAGKALNFLFRMACFTLAFFWAVDFVFACDYDNKIGMVAMLFIVIAIMGWYLFEAKSATEKRSHCYKMCSTGRFDD